MGIFLGLDSSTQSLSATIIDTGTGAVLHEAAVNFGSDLPQFDSPNGVLSHADPAVRHANPLLWVDALELLLTRLKALPFDLARIDGIAGAGQQHGSVYLKRSLRTVGGWKPEASLREQVAPLLARPTAPIWMDASTGAQCRAIEAAIGGARVVTISGSRATERFTGPQVKKFHDDSPTDYERTEEIHLVSSFIASLLVADTAPIDLGDGAGMNLLDLSHASWSTELLNATAPDLARRLPGPVASETQVGTVAPYFIEKYGFRSGVPVLAFTGDNPSSLVGMGATAPGTAVISLGTSDTMFAAMSEPHTDPRGFGHVFGNPAGGFMCLICFANGSLAREAVAERFSLNWEDFASAILESTPPGNDGNLLLPYFVPEITPKIHNPQVALFGTPRFTEWGDAASAARAVVEAQALSMRHHADWIGAGFERVLVTGGASRNRGILRVLADVFQAEIMPLSVSNSAALGGALRAAHAFEKADWRDLFATFAAPDASLATPPNVSSRTAYDELAARWREKLAAFTQEQ